MANSQAANILKALKGSLAMPDWTVRQRKPFETLIATIISQNTNDKNTEQAFKNLSKMFRITPYALSKADINEVEICLNIAGLYHDKAKVIKGVSKAIIERFDGSLENVLSLPMDEAREKLLGLKGVGPKTADVVLLFSANQPTIPVDTHVNRVSKRLGLTPSSGNYEAVRLSLQSLFEPKDYLALHLLLISLGRAYCKARKPLCGSCPVDCFCSSKILVAE